VETNRKQQASEVLHADGEGTKEARQRNTRMGQASDGYCENFGGFVGVSYVFAQKYCNWAPFPFPKGASGPGDG